MYVENWFGNVVRIDATTGRADQSLVVRGFGLSRLLPDGDLLYLLFPGGRGTRRNRCGHRSGARGRPSVLPDPRYQTVVSAAIMGQTMYFAHTHSLNFDQGLVAVDRDSAVTLPFPASFDGRVQDLAVADDSCSRSERRRLAAAPPSPRSGPMGRRRAGIRRSRVWTTMPG